MAKSHVALDVEIPSDVQLHRRSSRARDAKVSRASICYPTSARSTCGSRSPRRSRTPSFAATASRRTSTFGSARRQRRLGCLRRGRRRAGIRSRAKRGPIQPLPNNLEQEDGRGLFLMKQADGQRRAISVRRQRCEADTQAMKELEAVLVAFRDSTRLRCRCVDGPREGCPARRRCSRARAIARSPPIDFPTRARPHRSRPTTER